MGTIFDYLEWRGDLSFEQAPLNAVDNLILSQISYLPFDGIIPGPEERNVISLAEAAAAVAAFIKADPKKAKQRLTCKEDPQLLETLAASPRYRDLGLAAYVNVIDISEEKQFAAVTVIISRRETFISFRGTDNTLVGWKEDFNMSFSPSIPAQLEAVAYLEKTAKYRRGSLWLGGHSKGGNLAVYAASFCKRKVQRRVAGIFSNDGPGFSRETLADKGYQAVRDKVQTFVPQSSVIGMLFEHEDDYTVVKSSQTSLMQHEIYSWEVSGGDVVRLDTVTQESRFIDRTIKEWAGGLDPVQRRRFIDAVFEILSSTEAKSLPELTENWFKNTGVMIQSFSRADRLTQELITKTITALFRAAKNNLPALLKRSG
ncbi:MAG: DUF2974 domain-containing protein [Treponema sp.]|nr:DUF2974 domain-containing protein [Treponema sp.]